MKIKVSTPNTNQEVDIYTPEGLKVLSDLWLKVSCHNRLMYEPTWMGIPIIQFPDDILMMQELIWKVRPDVIVETGLAHGGSAIFHSSLLELLGKGRVIGIDVEIRKYNAVAIQSHPMSKRITLIEKSSTDPEVIRQLRTLISPNEKVLVVLDSNHSYAHVKKEIELYSQFVSDDSYLVVMDGAQELVAEIPNGKPEWKDDNPLRAIREFLETQNDWEEDPYYNRMQVTSNPRGYLKRKKRKL